MNLIDCINQHPNNNPIELANLILEQGFSVNRGMVYILDEDTVVKHKRIVTEDVAQSVQRVNSIVPGFIKEYEIQEDNTVKLFMQRYEGNHPMVFGTIEDKEHAIQILNECLNFIEKAKPYIMNDFCSGNIIVGDKIHIIDLDQIFDNDYTDLSPQEYYRRMQWLKPYVDLQEFIEIWNNKF